MASASLLGTAVVLGVDRAPASASSSCPPADDPLLGSWQVQVSFLAGPRLGHVQQTLITFNAGGGVVESDATGAWAHAGAWTRTSSRGHDYEYTLVELSYDPTAQTVTQIVVPRIRFSLSSDRRRLTSTSAATDVYVYDPATGAQVTTVHLPDVSRVTGTRIGVDYVPPERFAA